MVRFFCTRCGTPLEIESAYAGGRVRCGNCSTVVGSPAASEAVLDAAVQSVQPPPIPAVGLSPVPALPPPLPLSYVPAWPERQRWSVAVEEIAGRLEHVQADDEGPEAMINCRYCGSTIARFVRKCPYCRHPLWGI